MNKYKASTNKKIINNNKRKTYNQKMRIVIKVNLKLRILVIKMQAKLNIYNVKLLKWRGRVTKNFKNNFKNAIYKRKFVKIEV